MNFRITPRFVTSRFVMGIAALAVSASASAHPGHGEITGFVAGFSHPLLGLDHVLAMLAVGMWAAQSRHGGKANVVWRAPLAFIAAMLAGALLGLSGVSVPFVEPLIAASVLVFGLLVSLRARASLAVLPLVAAFAVFHGIAHGAEFSPGGASVATWMAGFTLATALLHITGVAIGAGLRNNALRLRLAGVPIAITGAALMVQMLPA